MRHVLAAVLFTFALPAVAGSVSVPYASVETPITLAPSQVSGAGGFYFVTWTSPVSAIGFTYDTYPYAAPADFYGRWVRFTAYSGDAVVGTGAVNQYGPQSTQAVGWSFDSPVTRLQMTFDGIANAYGDPLNTLHDWRATLHTPEPSTYALLALGLGMLGLLMRRRAHL